MSNAIIDLTRKQLTEPEPNVRALAQLLIDRFPEETAGENLSDPENVLRLTMELLNRLWRWER